MTTRGFLNRLPSGARLPVSGVASGLTMLRATTVLISGVPATGKSSFGDWVAATKGGTHVDLESDGIARYGLSDAWNRLLSSRGRDTADWIELLKALAEPVVITWGYPAPLLPYVMALHAGGVEAWWFDGDRAAARVSFLSRGTVPEAALDIQMQGINQADRQLKAFYLDRTVITIDSQGTFCNWEHVYQRIFGGP